MCIGQFFSEQAPYLPGYEDTECLKMFLQELDDGIDEGMDIHLQMANGAHQKHIELCGQVQGQQDLQMFADHAAHGYQVQQDLVREEFGMFSDHNAGCTGSGLDPSTG